MRIQVTVPAFILLHMPTTFNWGTHSLLPCNVPFICCIMKVEQYSIQRQFFTVLRKNKKGKMFSNNFINRNFLMKCDCENLIVKMLKYSKYIDCQLKKKNSDWICLHTIYMFSIVFTGFFWCWRNMIMVL